MKFTRWIYLIVLLALLAACGGGGGVTPPGATRTSSLPTAQVTVIPAPSTDASLRAFLGAMQSNDYASMYKQISTASQAVISEADFSKRYSEALDAMGVTKVEYNILSSLTNPQSAQVAFSLTYKTVLFGDFQRDFNTTLVLENGE